MPQSDSCWFLIEKEIELRKELNTEFGMEERKKNDDLPAHSEVNIELADNRAVAGR